MRSDRDAAASRVDPPVCATSFLSSVQFRCDDSRTPEMHLRLDKPQCGHALGRAHPTAWQFIRKTAAVGLGTT
jgi:hypothetical protein